MNKYFKLCRGIFAIIILMIIFSCSNTSPEQFYGSWRNTRGDTILDVKLSNESWEAKFNMGSSYTIDQLTWVHAINDDPATKSMYPEGYYITGTVSSLHNVSGISQGQQNTYMIYLNKDKTSFLRKSDNTPDFIFNKND